ncbi:MAG: hypothetical protein JOZ43_07850 [Acidobacteriales bacterium]|nr:hypothetical protein [Terriglobales bacterium]
MKRLFALLFLAHLCAFAKVHVITFSPWQKVKLVTGDNEDALYDMWVRTLFVDARMREFTVGEPHDITDRLFVVRRAYRVNDTLPNDEPKKKVWRWQRGGWLLIDRLTGSVKQLALPEFDTYYSTASWFRDYVAYCGISDNADKLYAVVVEVGRRKPVVKKLIGAPATNNQPDSECAAPEWSRKPMSVSFAPSGKDKISFTVRGRLAEIQTLEHEEDDSDGQ